MVPLYSWGTHNTIALEHTRFNYTRRDETQVYGTNVLVLGKQRDKFTSPSIIPPMHENEFE